MTKKERSEIAKILGSEGGKNRMKLLDAEGRRKLAQKAGLKAGQNRREKEKGQIKPILPT